MSLATLAGEYELLTCLSNNALSRVYLAVNSGGDKVIVKFLMESDRFFDELARYYACDDSQHICKVLYNYPAYEVSRKPFIFTEDLLKLLGGESLLAPGTELTVSRMMNSRMASVGAIVLEYVDGRPLLEVFHLQKEKEKLYYLKQLANAIAEMHQNEEYHGDLVAENVLVRESDARVFLIGLGFFNGKRNWPPTSLSPEHRIDDGEGVGFPSDVYMFARNFLTHLEDPSRTTLRLIQSCVSEDPSDRPSIHEISKKIEKAHHVASRPLAGFNRSFFMKLASLTVFLFTSAIGITFVARNPVLDMREQAIVHAELDPTKAIEKLYDLRRAEIIDSEWQQILARDIATIKKNQADFSPIPFNPGELARPLAVFAFKRDPLVISENAHYNLGDWVSFNGQNGYVEGINSRQIIFNFDGNERRLHFDEPDFYVRHTIDEPCVIVWNHEENLSQLLDGAISKTNWDHLETPLSLAEYRSQQVSYSNGKVYGSFDAQNMHEFLSRVEQHLDFEDRGNQVDITVAEGQLPLYLTFNQFIVEEIPAEVFCKDFSETLGIEIELPGYLHGRMLKRQPLLNRSWQDLFYEAGFRWVIAQKGGNYKIIVKELL